MKSSLSITSKVRLAQPSVRSFLVVFLLVFGYILPSSALADSCESITSEAECSRMGVLQFVGGVTQMCSCMWSDEKCTTPPDQKCKQI